MFLLNTGPYPCFFVPSTCTQRPTVSCFFNVLLEFFGEDRKKINLVKFLRKISISYTPRQGHGCTLKDGCYLLYFCLSLSLFSSGVSTHSKNGSCCLGFFLVSNFFSSFMRLPHKLVFWQSMI